MKSVRIGSFSRPYLSVSSPNAGKHGPQKFPNQTLFTPCQLSGNYSEVLKFMAPKILFLVHSLFYDGIYTRDAVTGDYLLFNSRFANVMDSFRTIQVTSKKIKQEQN